MMKEELLVCKTYIGDGAYVGYDPVSGYVWIYTSNGIHVINEIALEPPVLENFQRWIEALSRKFQK